MSRPATPSLVVKVGTSTLTRGDGPPDEAYIADLAAQIARQRDAGRAVILVSSGAIRAGMAALNMTARPRTIPQKQAAAAVGQGALIHTYARAFAAHGLIVGQVLLTRDDLSNRTRYLNARNTFDALLQHGVVPIVNENDTVSVDEIKFGDNDTLAALVASLVDADSLLLLSDVAGLYDKDPTQFPDAALIPLVESLDERHWQGATGSVSLSGTGGMAAKLKAAQISADAGVRLTIAEGRRPNVIADALAGNCGTLFLPRARRLRARQRWLAHSMTPNGTLSVNDGARRRLVSDGKSLLPAGVVAVTGHFHAGDLVRLSDSSGETFAQGVVNYDSDSLAKIMGLRSEEAADVLGEASPAEVVHRDNLVLDSGAIGSVAVEKTRS